MRRSIDAAKRKKTPILVEEVSYGISGIAKQMAYQ